MPCEKTFQGIVDPEGAHNNDGLIIRFDVDLSSDGLSGPGRAVAVIGHRLAAMIIKMRDICVISGADPIRAPAHNMISYREYDPEAGDSTSDDNYDEVPVDESWIIVGKDRLHFEARLHGAFGPAIVGPEILIDEIEMHFGNLLQQKPLLVSMLAAA